MRVPVCSAPDFTTTVPRAAFRCMLTWPDLAPVYAPCQMCCKHQPTMSIEIKRRDQEKGGNNKQQQQAGREKRQGTVGCARWEQSRWVQWEGSPPGIELATPTGVHLRLPHKAMLAVPSYRI